MCALVFSFCRLIRLFRKRATGKCRWDWRVLLEGLNGCSEGLDSRGHAGNFLTESLYLRLLLTVFLEKVLLLCWGCWGGSLVWFRGDPGPADLRSVRGAAAAPAMTTVPGCKFLSSSFHFFVGFCFFHEGVGLGVWFAGVDACSDIPCIP